MPTIGPSGPIGNGAQNPIPTGTTYNPPQVPENQALKCLKPLALLAQNSTGPVWLPGQYVSILQQLHDRQLINNTTFFKAIKLLEQNT